MDEAFAAAERTLSLQWNRAVAAAKTIIIELGSVLAPTARRVIDFAQDFLEWFRKLPPGIKELVAQALLLGPVLIAAGVAAKGLAIALGGLAPVAAIIATITREDGHRDRRSVGCGTRLARGRTWACGRYSVASMLRLQAVGVAAASALNIAWTRLYLTMKFAGVKGVVLSVWAAIQASGVAAFGAVRAAAIAAYATIIGGAVGAVGKVMAAFAAVKGAAVAAFTAIKGLTLASLWAGIKGVAIAAFVALKGAIVAAFAAAKGAIVAAFSRSRRGWLACRSRACRARGPVDSRLETGVDVLPRDVDRHHREP